MMTSESFALLRTAVLCTIMACAASAAQAQSSYRACMIESPLHGMGAPTIVTDCLQGAKHLRRTAIKERCEGVAWHAAGGMGRRNLVDLTWLAQCPRREADAVCQGAFDGDFDLYHYDRNEGQLDALAEQCESEGGQWREFE